MSQPAHSAANNEYVFLSFAASPQANIREKLAGWAETLVPNTQPLTIQLPAALHTHTPLAPANDTRVLRVRVCEHTSCPPHQWTVPDPHCSLRAAVYARLFTDLITLSSENWLKYALPFSLASCWSTLPWASPKRSATSMPLVTAAKGEKP